MRLFEILVLVSVFCLVSTKAEDEADAMFDDFLDDQLDVVPVEESFVDDGADNTADETLLSEDPTLSKRPIRRPRPLILPIRIPGYSNSLVFKSCYCFRRRCYGKYKVVVSVKEPFSWALKEKETACLVEFCSA